MRKIALFLYFPCEIYKLKSKRDLIGFVSLLLNVIHRAISDGADCLSLMNVLITNYSKFMKGLEASYQVSLLLVFSSFLKSYLTVALPGHSI